MLRNNSVSSIEQVFMRHLVAFIFALSVLVVHFSSKGFKGFRGFNSLDLQLGYFLQGSVLNLMILVYVVSISLKTPVGEAALLVQIHPISTFIISYLWLKETIDRNKLTSVFIAFIASSK